MCVSSKFYDRGHYDSPNFSSVLHRNYFVRKKKVPFYGTTQTNLYFPFRRTQICFFSIQQDRFFRYLLRLSSDDLLPKTHTLPLWIFLLLSLPPGPSFHRSSLPDRHTEPLSPSRSRRTSDTQPRTYRPKIVILLSSETSTSPGATLVVRVRVLVSSTCTVVFLLTNSDGVRFHSELS